LEQFFALEKQLVFAIIDNLGISLSAEERDAIAKVPTESYLAFLAYSRGLDYQSRGMSQAAKQEFQKATEIDKTFDLANYELQSVTLTGGDYGESFAHMESTVRDDMNRPGGLPGEGLDGRLTDIVINGGDTPFRRDNNPPPIRPPLTAVTVRVIIRGDLDAL
jgi:hypothetical protein